MPAPLRRKKNLIDDRHKDQNPYYTFYQGLDPKLQEKVRKSPFHLLRAALGPYLADVSQAKETQNLLNSLAWTVLHGDFHIQQMAYRDGVVGLDDFDDVGFGPFWLDLVRLEASALLVAKSESFGDYAPGACVRAYVAKLADPKKETAAKPYTPKKSSDENAKPFAHQSIWKKASHSVPEDAEKAIRDYLSKAEPNEKIGGIRTSGGTGMGSFAVAKYVVLFDSDRLLEFKEELDNPLSDFRGLDAKPAPAAQAVAAPNASTKACQRFLTGAAAFRPDVHWGCATFMNKSFAVIPWSRSYDSPEPSDFANSQSLRDHSSWMCSQLATAHMKNIAAGDLTVLTNTLQKNPVFVTRLLRLAQQEADVTNTGYRLILNNDGKN